jgi:hypothetical protein
MSNNSGGGVDISTITPTRGRVNETLSRLCEHSANIEALARSWARFGDVTVLPEGLCVHYFTDDRKPDDGTKGREADMEQTPEAFFRRAVQNVVDEWELDVRSLHTLIGSRFLRSVVLAECCDLIMDLVPDTGEVPADRARLIVGYTRYACTRTLSDAD